MDNKLPFYVFVILHALFSLFAFKRYIAIHHCGQLKLDLTS